jgi:hypothetical protein
MTIAQQVSAKKRWPKPLQGWFDFLARQTRPPEHSVAFRLSVVTNVTVALLSVGLSLDWPWFVGVGTVFTWLAMALSYNTRNRNNWDVKAALSIGMVLALFRFFWTFVTGDVSDPRVPLAELLVWLQMLHSFDLPGRRDLNYSLLVALILMSIAAVTSNSMNYGLCLLVYALTYFVAGAIHVQRLQIESLSASVQLPSSRRSRGDTADLVWRWTRFWLQLLVFSGLLFLVFPKFQSFKIRALPFNWKPRLNLPRVGRGRVQNPGFPKTSDPKEFRKQARQSSQGYAGFNQIVDLQLRGALEPKLALKVRRSRPSYLRGLVFDHYDGQFWTCSDTSTKTLSCLTPPVTLNSGFSPSFSELTGDELSLLLDSVASESYSVDLITSLSLSEIVNDPCEAKFPRLDDENVVVPVSVYCLETCNSVSSQMESALVTEFLGQENLEVVTIPGVSVELIVDAASRFATALGSVGEVYHGRVPVQCSPYSARSIRAVSLFESPMGRLGHKSKRVANYTLTNVLDEQVQIISVESELPNIVLASAEPHSLYFPGDEVYRDRNGNVLSPYPLELGMLYSVISQEPKEIPELLDQLSPVDGLGEKQNRPCLQLPVNYSTPGTPEFKLRELSHQLTDRQPNSYRRILALVHHLSQNYEYDLQVDRYPDDSDIAAHFVLTQKRGYCEQFATSLAVMTRCIGLPSRYVTGYLPGNYNPFTGNFEILSSDAHAWTEVYVPNFGWLTFDATPPGQAQRKTMLSGETDSMWTFVRHYLKGTDLRFPFAVIFGCLGLMAILRHLLRKPMSTIRQALVLCEQHGYKKPPGCTLSQFAQDCKLDSLSNLVRLQEEALYRSGQSADLAEMSEALRLLKRELKERGVGS